MGLNRTAAFLLVVSLLTAGGLARLGFWQLSRADQKQALQAAITERTALPRLANADLVGPGDDSAQLLHRQVRVRGRWQHAATVFLDNRPMAGRVGFIVVTPLLLEGRSDAIAVQRGWIPRDAADRTRLLPVPQPEGLVDVEGRLSGEPSALLELQATEEATGPIRQNLKLNAYALEAGVRLVPLSVLQQAPPESAFVRDWPSPVVNVQKHHGYAFQWFAMSALVVGLYVWFQLIRPSRVRSSKQR
ncbi:MAG: SURF1 family protein [Pseudomonadota bacterium]